MGSGVKDRNKLKTVDDDSSMQGDDSESAQLYSSDRHKPSTQRKKF